MVRLSFMPRVGSASLLPSDDDRMTRRSVRLARLAAVSLFLFWPTPCICQTQARSVLCRGGEGTFDAEFRTGVKVHVGAARTKDGGSEGFATHACAARLSWEKQELLVATDASQLDLDAFGVDLGDGIPVACFSDKEIRRRLLRRLRNLLPGKAAALTAHHYGRRIFQRIRCGFGW